MGSMVCWMEIEVKVFKQATNDALLLYDRCGLGPHCIASLEA